MEIIFNRNGETSINDDCSGEFDLEKYRLKNLPSTVYYIPEFITSAEEDLIVSKFNSAPKPKWTQLLNRRLQNYGGLPHHKGMVPEPIPDWLQIFIDKIHRIDVMKGNKPNHVLANEYKSGQGIMFHEDGPIFYPTITTVSCGSHTVINFKNQDSGSVHSVLLERRSLFIVQEEMYHNYMHGIDELHSDSITNEISNLNLCSKTDEQIERGTRISLTIRHVPKTLKLKIKI